MNTYLEDLRPGERFRVLGSDLQGELLRINTCTATVRYDGFVTREIRSARDHTTVQIKAPHAPITIAPRTVVMRLAS